MLACCWDAVLDYWTKIQECSIYGLLLDLVVFIQNFIKGTHQQKNGLMYQFVVQEFYNLLLSDLSIERVQLN
jgi:hypothetical protein